MGQRTTTKPEVTAAVAASTGAGQPLLDATDCCIAMKTVKYNNLFLLSGWMLLRTVAGCFEPAAAQKLLRILIMSNFKVACTTVSTAGRRGSQPPVNTGDKEKYVAACRQAFADGVVV
jgi:hypothetical protein